MAKRSDPALPLYASDLLADEKFGDLPRDLRGCLVLLWCVAWKSGPIAPEQFPRVCRQIDASPDELATLLRLFFVEGEDGRWRSRRLEDERDERKALRSHRAEAGRKGNASRWGAPRRPDPDPSDRNGDRKPIANGVANGIARPIANGSPSASASSSASDSPSTSVSGYNHDPGSPALSLLRGIESRTRTTGTGGPA